jgi:hypothetical protein
LELGAALLAVLLCLAIIATTAARRLLRRHRRHRGSTSMQVVGAWDEAVDRLADAGVQIHGSQTVLELAARASQCAADQPASGHPARDTREPRSLALAAPFLEELAVAATEAAFSSIPPSPEDADRAWHVEGQLARALHRGWRAPYRAVHWIVPVPRPKDLRRQ